jgi:hypothetical protein
MHCIGNMLPMSIILLTVFRYYVKVAVSFDGGGI